MEWERIKKKSQIADLVHVESILHSLSESVDMEYFSENRKSSIAALEVEKH